jgi:hypothetical protein
LTDDVAGHGKPIYRDDSIVLNEKLRGRELVELTGHVQQRMKERGVSQEDVLNTIRNPTKSVPSTQSGRLRFRWQKTPRTFIDVVFEESKDRVCVVTVIKITRSLIRRRRK